jgi:hypothetical protein
LYDKYSGVIPPCHSCFAAGTVVWTLEGKKSIENIYAGDMVLAKNIETGELTYKPVLRTTLRPPSNMLRIKSGSDTFECTEGHLFWVSGEGWVKASKLQPGSLLHTAERPVRVASVEKSAPTPTFNLVVADFSTYFVGEEKILSHDVTMQEPTMAVVPGLVIAP